METIPNVVSVVARKVNDERKTHRQISDELKQQYPGVRGLSSRSVTRFCDVHDIHRNSKLTAGDLDRVVASSIAMVTFFVVIYFMGALYFCCRCGCISRIQPHPTKNF